MDKLICPYRQSCDGPCAHSRPHKIDKDYPSGHDCTETPCKHVKMQEKVYCRKMTKEEEIVEAL